MRHRGSQYWAWSDCQLSSRSHDEVLSDGTQLNVQTRISRNGATQVFIGLYGEAGEMMIEEFYASLPDQTLSSALVWAINRARALTILSASPTHQRD